MTFENITKNAVLNAVGRLIDAGTKTTMPVEYYAKNKEFIDNYVAEKKAKITGESEYNKFINGTDKKNEQKKEAKTDLMEEVRNEEAEVKEEAAENKAKKSAVAKKAEEAKSTEDTPVKTESTPVRKTTRRKPAAKKDTSKAE